MNKYGRLSPANGVGPAACSPPSTCIPEYALVHCVVEGLEVKALVSPQPRIVAISELPSVWTRSYTPYRLSVVRTMRMRLTSCTERKASKMPGSPEAGAADEKARPPMFPTARDGVHTSASQNLQQLNPGSRRQGMRRG